MAVEEMHPYRFFASWRDFNELKQRLNEAIARGLVEEVPVTTTREAPRIEKWYRDKQNGDIYSLIPPEPPARGMWEPVDSES